MNCTIFYSWQSDLESRCNRSFIQNALERAAKIIRKDESILVEPRIDEGTKGIAGAPAIADIIFSKIAQADIFACDVSIINRGSKFRKTPNPNVLIEVGYAKRALPYDQHILIFNTASGNIKDIPFDLQGTRLVQYRLVGNESEQGKAAIRKELESRLVGEIRAILENIQLKRSTIPELCLKLIGDKGYSDQIVLNQQRIGYTYGVSLQNITKGSIPAENIDINIECHWRGNNLTFAPAFFTFDSRRMYDEWSERRQELTSDQPAVLVYHGNQDRCAYGHPHDWHEFSLMLKERVDGYFLLRYHISSTSPITNSEGELRIVMA
jgi:hypothetical protein